MKIWRQEIALFIAALRYFTRLPLPAATAESLQHMNSAMRYYPLVGALVGAVGGLTVCLATALHLAPGPAVALGMLATVLLTGAMHEDAFCDVCDAFGAAAVAGAASIERRLAIMKDTHMGSFAAVGIVLLLLIKWNALTTLLSLVGHWRFVALCVLAHAVSRLASMILIVALAYARTDGRGKAVFLTGGMRKRDMAGACVGGLWPVVFLGSSPWSVGIALLAAAATALWALRFFRRGLNGYTGDCLGATQQISEVMFYLGFLCSLS